MKSEPTLNSKRSRCRDWMQRGIPQTAEAGRWDLGSVIKPNAKVKNYQYFIFRAKLDKFLGIEPRADNEEVENEADQ